MKKVISLPLETGYNGYVAGALIPVRCRYTVYYAIPIQATQNISFKISLIETSTGDVIYSKTYAMNQGEEKIIVGSFPLICNKCSVSIVVQALSVGVEYVEGPYDSVTVIPA
jgi:hypothetical protein